MSGDIYAADYGIDDVEIVDDSVVYQGFFQIRSLKLRHRLFEGGWSAIIRRELFVRHDAVGVLLYDPVLDAIALVEQFRVGAYGHELQHQGDSSPWLLELVAGLIDKEEPAEYVAEREAIEEAGAVVDMLTPIGRYYSSPGGSSEYFYLFCGRCDLSAVQGVHGLDVESEDIRVHVLPVETAWHKLLSGEINNAHTIIAMQWLKLNRQSVREDWLRLGRVD